jgi:hypothetical protein
MQALSAIGTYIRMPNTGKRKIHRDMTECVLDYTSTYARKIGSNHWYNHVPKSVVMNVR